MDERKVVLRVHYIMMANDVFLFHCSREAEEEQRHGRIDFNALEGYLAA